MALANLGFRRENALKPTVHDIARTAGVSLATVDRVLNARPGVREKTVERVQTAVRTLGYVRDISAANLARQRQYRFAFVLPEAATAFLAALRAEVGAASDHAFADRTSLSVHEVPSLDPYAVAQTLGALDEVDGVAVMAPDTPQVRDAVRRLKERGVAVVTLVSDLTDAGRDHFAGINNLAAGRTAAQLLGRFLGGRTGEVAVLAGSMLARDHVERRLGFDEVMRAGFPGLEILPTLEVRDDAERVARLLPGHLAAHPAVVGLYSIGAGNRGLVRALEDCGRAGEITVIGHELTPHMRMGLLSGAIDAVINQDVGHVVRSALRVLRARADGTAIVAAQERIRIDIFIRENLP
jgi:LacI family transcriptional regulator